jgi:hypothetical protein
MAALTPPAVRVVTSSCTSKCAGNSSQIHSSVFGVSCHSHKVTRHSFLEGEPAFVTSLTSFREKTRHKSQ